MVSSHCNIFNLQDNAKPNTTAKWANGAARFCVLDLISKDGWHRRIRSRQPPASGWRLWVGCQARQIADHAPLLRFSTIRFALSFGHCFKCWLSEKAASWTVELHCTVGTGRLARASDTCRLHKLSDSAGKMLMRRRTWGVALRKNCSQSPCESLAITAWLNPFAGDRGG